MLKIHKEYALFKIIIMSFVMLYTKAINVENAKKEYALNQV
jgi:hypothetical protein